MIMHLTRINYKMHIQDYAPHQYLINRSNSHIFTFAQENRVEIPKLYTRNRNKYPTSIILAVIAKKINANKYSVIV
jgi:hypothetical protein